MSQRIAIQGLEGSFHEEAAKRFFGEHIELVFCSNFQEVVKVAGDTTISDGAVMAIENSIAGSILPNYNLLQKSDLRIVGEVYLPIHQNLMVNPGVKREDIREVHSHPMALLQCLDFLNKHPWKLVESEDTAMSARHIHQHKSTHIAVIASKRAADLYGLDIINPNIETYKNNYTRFLVLQQKNGLHEIPADANKASVYFHTDHSKGILAKVLTVVAGADINLSKLQSFPLAGSDWKYCFYMDVEFDTVAQFYAAIDAITPLTEELRVYGVYKKDEIS